MARLERLTLRLRLLVILMVSLLAVQVLSIGAAGWVRGQGARYLANDLIVADVLRVRAQLASQPPQARAAMLELLARATYHWQLASPSVILPASTAPRIHDLADRLAAVLDGTPVRAVDLRGSTALRLPLDPADDLLVVFPAGLPASTPQPWAAAAYLLLVTAAVAVLAWLAVRIATAPLAQAADAARAMAVDLHAPALRETGPAELRELASGMNLLQREVQRQLQARTQMLSAISHDLRTPITRMKLRIGAVQDAALRQRFEDDLDAMATLVDEGLTFARSGQLHEARHPVDLDALIENIVEQMHDQGRHCEYTPVELPAVQAAPHALARLLQNLVDNAVRHGGGAQIEVESLGDEIEVRVGDRGPGVPEDQLERMFEPFVRGETSRGRDQGGSGLGLAIARNIAQAHGGRLWLEPRAGGGLLARLRLKTQAPACVAGPRQDRA